MIFKVGNHNSDAIGRFATARWSYSRRYAPDDDDRDTSTPNDNTVISNPNPNSNPTPIKLLHVSFNRDYGCFDTGADRGFESTTLIHSEKSSAAILMGAAGVLELWRCHHRTGKWGSSDTCGVGGRILGLSQPHDDLVPKQMDFRKPWRNIQIFGMRDNSISGCPRLLIKLFGEALFSLLGSLSCPVRRVHYISSSVCLGIGCPRIWCTRIFQMKARIN